MKRVYTLTIVLLWCMLVFVSCKDEKNPVQQYGDTLIHGYKSAQKLKKDVTVQQLQKSVQEFQAANGRYPADLKELEDFTRIHIDIDNYTYDPATGIITAKQ